MNTHERRHRHRPFVPAGEEHIEIAAEGAGYETPQPVTLLPEAEQIQPEAEPEAEPSPSHTWEPIDTAPHDGGRDIIVRYGEDDTEGRVVRWKNGRRFNGRQWLFGGRWMPVDSMMPLPAEEPSEWARPANYETESVETEAA